MSRAIEVIKLLENKEEKIGDAIKGKFGDYKKSPGDFTIAANYAYYLADKNKKDVFIFKGNSYGTAIYRIAFSDTSEEIHKQTAMKPKKGFVYAKITPSGEVFRVVWE